MSYIKLNIILFTLAGIYYILLYFKFKRDKEKEERSRIEKNKELKDKEKQKNSAIFEDILVNTKLPENFEKELKDIFR